MEAFSARGMHVELKLLSHDYREDFKEAIADGNLDKLWFTIIPSPEGVAPEIDRRLSLYKEGSMLPFTVMDPKAGKAVGMTTYMNISPGHKKLEIGYTWYRQSHQKTLLNTECKYFLLKHAFEVLKYNCVEFRTHSMNFKSRRAIERLGARLDGILRQDTLMPNGTVRDTAAYSIVASEWPTVKVHLEYLLSL